MNNHPQIRVLAVFSILLLAMLAAVPRALSQTNNASLSILVQDPSQAVIPGAQVTISSVDTGLHLTLRTDRAGNVVFPSLQPISYTLSIRKQGFAETVVDTFKLNTADSKSLVVTLKIGTANQSVTVSGATLTTDSPAVSMTVSREFVENMPLNGRSFQDLIQLAPGAVSSQNGYYSINGQRTNSNNYTVDGVSANLGGTENNPVANDYGAALAGGSPSQTVVGTTQSLASVDDLQEFTIQTSGYTAEYGRNPGGQVQFTTRSGTNEIHGSLFDYLRNTAFDANSWYNNYYDIPQAAEHQNDFGGTIGGPVIVPKLYNGRDRTFYFFSYEGLRLLLPYFENEYVPTQALRNWASPNVQPFLNAMPLPSPDSPGNQDGCVIPDSTTGQPTACDALFNAAYSHPEDLDNTSFRIDEAPNNHIRAFVRYADTPSSEMGGASKANPTKTAVNGHTWTAGVTANISRNILDEFRFNFGHDGEQLIRTLQEFGGSVPWARGLLIPVAYESPYDNADPRITISGTSLALSPVVSGVGSVQHQYQIVDSLAWTREKHNLKFGIDWRRLMPTFTSTPYYSEIEINSLAAIQQGYATTVYIEATAPGQPVVNNLSLYAQDHWKLTPTLSLDYGLRWEFNPPPGASNGHYPVTLTSNDFATATITNDGTQPYKTNYHSIAPRFGFAWNAVSSQKHPMTVRGGFGVFFDTGQSMAANAYTTSYPFNVSGPTESNVPLPLSSAASAPPSLNASLTPPYPFLAASDPNLTLPYTEQWNLSVDEMLNTNNTLTVSYVGNNGRKLLFTAYYEPVPGNAAFTGIEFTNNESQSSYNALQIQDTGRIANGLDLVAAFTWAHALDNASSDFGSTTTIYGNSDYDLRRVLNLALNYRIPIAGWNHVMESLTHGWLFANRFSTQSGYPITTLYQARVDLPNGTDVYYYPDVVPGVPIYLHGRAADVDGQLVPGSWRLNRAAFACTTNGATSGACPGTPTRQGDLGRNDLRNPSFWALNTALQRNFPIREKLRLNFRAEAFNIFNHPNFGNPTATLSSSLFGQLSGTTATIGSSNSLYAMGAARSLQFSLRVEF